MKLLKGAMAGQQSIRNNSKGSKMWMDRHFINAGWCSRNICPTPMVQIFSRPGPSRNAANTTDLLTSCYVPSPGSRKGYAFPDSRLGGERQLWKLVTAQVPSEASRSNNHRRMHLIAFWPWEKSCVQQQNRFRGWTSDSFRPPRQSVLIKMPPSSGSQGPGI